MSFEIGNISQDREKILENKEEDTLIIADSVRSIEELDFLLQNTKVRTIYSKNNQHPFSISLASEKGFTYAGYPYYDGLYKDCYLIREKESIPTPEYLEFVTNSLDNLEDVAKLWRRISPDAKEVKRVTLKDEAFGKLGPEGSDIIINMADGVIQKVRFPKGRSIEDIEKVTSFLEKYGYSQTEIEWTCENKTYKDLDKLVEINQRHPIKINYGEPIKTNLDNFIGMRQTIDWYKQLINEGELSPAERLLYAYDIIKSFGYNESSVDSNDSRYIPEIIQTGNIVCVGYSSFIEQLLKELDIPTAKISVSVKVDDKLCGHARNVVRLDDDKYNIHGLYAFDATWDSAKDDLYITSDDSGKKRFTIGREEGDTKAEQVDGLALYQNFLIPIKDYNKRYPNEVFPGIVRAGLQATYPEEEYLGVSEPYHDKITPDSLDIVTEQNFEKLFGTKEITPEVIDYMSAKKPSVSSFEEMLYNVRRQEGYDAQSAKTDVESSVEINQMLDEIRPEQYRTFFRTDQNRK